MEKKEYIEIPYKRIWFQIKEKAFLKMMAIFFISLFSTILFEFNYKFFKSNAVLEQASINNTSNSSLPIGVGNLLSNNQLSSKSTSFYLKSLNSFNFFEFLLIKDKTGIFQKDIFMNNIQKYEKFEIYKNIFSSSIDDLGFILLDAKCKDWKYCNNLLTFVIENSNAYIKSEYKKRSNLNIDSIMKQIESSNNFAVNSALLNEVIDEMIIKSRSESDNGYVFPVIQEPYSNREPITSSFLVFIVSFIFYLFIYISFVAIFQTFLKETKL
tara:strand:+ start:41 stop:847 length:807 start_codon:yes stop_codon:yes gene_type:complete